MKQVEMDLSESMKKNRKPLKSNSEFVNILPSKELHYQCAKCDNYNIVFGNSGDIKKHKCSFCGEIREVNFKS